MKKDNHLNIEKQDRQLFPLILVLLLELIMAFFVTKSDKTDYLLIHLMYTPIVIAVFFFDAKIGLLSSIIAELLIEVFSPVKQSLMDIQYIQTAAFRLITFIYTGLLVSYLKTRHDKKHFTENIFNKIHPYTNLPYWDSFKEDTSKLTKSKGIIHFKFFLIEINNQNELLATFGLDCIDQINKEIINRTQSRYEEGKLYLIRLNTFGLLLSDIKQNIIDLAQLFEEPILVNGIPLYCEVTIGEAAYPENGHTPDELLKNGFLALNEAKKHQKPYQQYDPTLFNPEIPVLLGQFQNAIKSKEIDFYYQPIVDKTGRVCSLEALVRWNHPIKGMIPPNDFIPDLEFTRMANHLTYYSVDINLERMKILYSQGFDLDISLNISITNLFQPDFAENIIALLEHNQFPAHHLALEITERGFISDDIESQKNLNALVRYGINISIDDFGVGFTSISNFQKNGISSIKIDQSFVHDIHNNQSNQAILEGIISIAKSSNIIVIAEGIEKKLEKEKALKLGIDCLQGYYISRPLSFSATQQWLLKH